MRTEPSWGHLLLTPDGRGIRVPSSAFARLRRLGCLMGHQPRLAPQIYNYLTSEYDCLTDGLRHLLGEDLSGPAWLVCHCKACQRLESDVDHTLDPLTAKAHNARLADEAIALMRRRQRSRCPR